MIKVEIVLLFVIFSLFRLSAQSDNNYDLSLGFGFQKTEALYWENGIVADYTSDFLVNKKIHLKAAYLTSRIGSAFASNAIKQDNFVIGADWRFRSEKVFQIFAGLNTGLFLVDYESEMFDVLPKSSMLFSVETGLVYHFKLPMTASLSTGYNLISGNGVDVPGSLFPVFYRLSVSYNINKH